MNFRLRDWIPGIILVVLLAVDILGRTVMPGLPTGLSVTVILFLLVIQLVLVALGRQGSESSD